jgi:hypothetical protein
LVITTAKSRIDWANESDRNSSSADAHGLAIAHLNVKFRGNMYYTLNVRQIGNSLGAVFPEELLQKLNIQEGDKFI